MGYALVNNKYGLVNNHMADPWCAYHRNDQSVIWEERPIGTAENSKFLYHETIY